MLKREESLFYLFYSLFYRRWREVGEQPCLWSTLDLDTGPVLWTQDLMLELLNIRRLQTLKQLNLDFFQQISWQDYIHLLQIIIENSPSIRKLSLEPKNLAVFEPRPPIDQLVEELVAKLVEFEEVDFGDDGFLRDTDIANAFLRGVTAMTSSGEDSKLRVLSMPGFKSSTVYPHISEAVAEARKSLTVNLLGFRARYILIDSFDEDEEDNGDEEEVEKSIHSDDEDSSSSAS